MPSVTKQTVPLSEDTTTSGGLFSKKRPRNESAVAIPVYDHNHNREDVLTIFVHSGNGGGSARRMAPLEKRARVDEDHCRTSPMRSSSFSARERVLLCSSMATTTTAAATTETATTTTAKALTPPSSLTTPCHVCQRRPRRKCDLDSFADCTGCNKRTCFVCLRECLGWRKQQQSPDGGGSHDGYNGNWYDGHTGGDTPTDGSITPIDEEQRVGRDLQSWLQVKEENTSGTNRHQLQQQRQQQQRRVWGSVPDSRGHRQVVCSQCCIERGEDGEIVCLGCLAHVGSG